MVSSRVRILLLSNDFLRAVQVGGRATYKSTCIGYFESVPFSTVDFIPLLYISSYTRVTHSGEELIIVGKDS